MSVVISAKVKVKNCTPQSLTEAAKILSKRFNVEKVRDGIMVGSGLETVTILVENGELKAVADSDFVSRERLNEILGITKDAVVAAEIVRAAKAMGKSVNVGIGEKGVLVEVMD